MATPPKFPFVPKSTAYIEPGHFWSIPLSNGDFACGRVLQLWIKGKKRDSRTFLVGLMDWCGSQPPTEEAIAGCSLLDQGEAHIKTIRETGGAVVGFRDLALDGIEPGLFRDAHGATCVQRGFDRLRPFNPATDANLPVFSAWGYLVIKVLAEKRFCKK